MAISEPGSYRGSPLIRRLRFRIRALLLVVAVLSLFMGIAHQLDRRWRLDRALLSAAQAGDAEAVRSLLDHGADVNAAEGGPSFWTPLMHAALRGDLELVRLLLDRGAEVDRQDGDGFTALTVAAEEGHWEVVKLLASRGADIHHRDATGRSALDRAGAGGESEVVSFLEAIRRRP
jgi:ankyrin repeat protein